MSQNACSQSSKGHSLTRYITVAGLQSSGVPQSPSDGKFFAEVCTTKASSHIPPFPSRFMGTIHPLLALIDTYLTTVLFAHSQNLLLTKPKTIKCSQTTKMKGSCVLQQILSGEQKSPDERPGERTFPGRHVSGARASSSGQGLAGPGSELTTPFVSQARIQRPVHLQRRL